jgi:hypothetical protein
VELIRRERLLSTHSGRSACTTAVVRFDESGCSDSGRIRPQPPETPVAPRPLSLRSIMKLLVTRSKEFYRT